MDLGFADLGCVEKEFMMDKVGIGKADITPLDASMSMGSFIVRNNQPTTGVLSRLFMGALVIESGDTLELLLCYELLGIELEVKAIVFQSLERSLRERFDVENCIGISTDTHRSPEVMNFPRQRPLDNKFSSLLRKYSKKKLLAWVEPCFSTVENNESVLKLVKVDQISVVSSDLPLANARLADQSILEKRIDQWAYAKGGNFAWMQCRKSSQLSQN